MEKVEIVRIEGMSAKTDEDYVSREVPFTINYAGKEIATLLCSPDNLKELAVGFLFSSGIIKEWSDVKNIVIDQDKWQCWIEPFGTAVKDIDKLLLKRLFTSGCGKGILIYNAADAVPLADNTSKMEISAGRIMELMMDFVKRSEGFKKTGGVHSACAADNNDIKIFMEDIGRHNAVDKVIGACLMKDIAMDKMSMLVTGRMSSEILFKTARCGITLLASRSAPTDQAIKIAEKHGITLIGFIRGNRMNIYSGKERIKC